MSNNSSEQSKWQSQILCNNSNVEEDGFDMRTLSGLEQGEKEDMTTNTDTSSNEGHEVVDRTFTSVNGNIFKNNTCSSFICAPYKCEVFAQQINENSPGSGRRTAIIRSLQDLGVKVFIIDADLAKTSAEILTHIRRVIGFIARENRVLRKSGPLGFQRCLLYQDNQGRLFNLVLSKYASGPCIKWEEYLETFSGLQAMIALVVLCRSFPCAVDVGSIGTFKPAYLSLILGLVLNEEISLSWLNSSMMVRAAPSVSAHMLVSPFGGSDLLRKGVIFVLALASAAEGITQQIMTLVGIAGACVVLLANLGARSWHFLRWKPQRYNGCGAAFLAYIFAIATGVILPYMGHRNIEVGGKAALEYVIRTSFFVAVAFVVSDIDQVQQFLVVGSESCNQNLVNFIVGIWWFITLACSLFFVRRIPYRDKKPQDSERLLTEDNASPAGYKVPNLPDYEIDPALARTGSKCFSLQVEFLFGLLMAVGLGGFITYLAFATWDEELIANFQAFLP